MEAGRDLTFGNLLYASKIQLGLVRLDLFNLNNHHQPPFIVLLALYLLLETKQTERKTRFNNFNNISEKEKKNERANKQKNNKR